MDFKYKNTAFLGAEDIKKSAKKLGGYISRLNKISKEGAYDEPEGFINLPFDKELFGEAEKIAKEKKTPKLKYIVVAGIGGSNLGATAVSEALLGPYDSLMASRLPKLIFADTVSPLLIKNISDVLWNNVSGPEEFVLNIVSKSGATTEAVANFETLYELLGKKFGDINSRVVVTTDRGSKLALLSQEKGILTLFVPQKVGGRYSVLSPAGIFPLILAGIDVPSLFKGAGDITKRCLADSVEKNPALASSALLYLNYKKGFSVNNNFFFNPELESLGKWHRQLMSESLGKEKKGITPIVSIGSADLHSMAQLYLGGPNDKFTYFTYAPPKEEIKAPDNLLFEGLVGGINGRSYKKIMEAILGGVKNAYKKRKIPFAEINLPDVSPYSLGEYLQFRMIETAFLGKLLSVNAFDQPNVEECKKETRKLLAKS